MRKRIVKITVFVFLLSFSFQNVKAQQWSKIALADDKIEMATMIMKDKYKLDSKQYESVLKLNRMYAPQIKPILLSDKSKMEKVLVVKPIAKKYEQELLKIFTKEQAITFQNVKNERRAALKSWLEN